MIMGIDIETYSSVDLSRSTVYRYVESPDFEILLFGFCLDDGPVAVIDLTSREMPEIIKDYLTDPAITKVAYNANFERVCLSRYYDTPLDPAQWQCTMVHAATLGLPRALGQCGSALRLADDKRKLETGKELIRYFCKPCKPTRANGERTRNLPEHAPDKWQQFVAYNKRDVETEREIRKKISVHPVPQSEWDIYRIDQKINDRGVLVDLDLVRQAIAINLQHVSDLTYEAQMLTGLANVNSVQQLKGWLGVEGSLDKKAIKALRGNVGIKEDRVLAIRQELGKTSVTKYQAMLNGVCSDGRVKGLFAFYGANRTGRWAGRSVQVQNLPQNHMPDLDDAREIVKEGDKDALQTLYGNVPGVLSELIRTAFVAPKGYTFAVADYSAIEARVIAWLSDCRWRQKVFKEGGDIYCASASQMFKVPVEKHGVNGHLRQKGKIAELALGYGGSVGALTTMGALEMGLQEAELQPIVTAWREANPQIVDLWWMIDDAVKKTIEYRDGNWRYDLPHGLSMRYTPHLLHIKLPSGRCLRYWEPGLEDGDYGRSNVTYWSTEAGKWTQVRSYGPKFVENIVQGIARDCLAETMKRLDERGFKVVMHVHDEVIVEVPKEDAERKLCVITEVMGTPIDWAPGLLLRGDGYVTDYYRKD